MERATVISWKVAATITIVPRVQLDRGRAGNGVRCRTLRGGRRWGGRGGRRLRGRGGRGRGGGGRWGGGGGRRRGWGGRWRRRRGRGGRWGRRRGRDWDVRDARGRNDAGRGRVITRSLHRRTDWLILVPTRESDKSVIVVGLRVSVESKLGVQLYNGIPVPLDLSVNRSAGGKRDAELCDTSGDVIGLRKRIAGGQGNFGRGRGHNNGINGVLHELVALRLSDRVRRSGGIPRVRPGPHIDLVLVDLGEGTGLEGVGVVGSHVQPGGVVKTVNPILAIGLVTLDGTDVVGLAVVVPGDDLDNVDLVAVVDN